MFKTPERLDPPGVYLDPSSVSTEGRAHGTDRLCHIFRIPAPTAVVHTTAGALDHFSTFGTHHSTLVSVERFVWISLGTFRWGIEGWC